MTIIWVSDTTSDHLHMQIVMWSIVGMKILIIAALNIVLYIHAGTLCLQNGVIVFVGKKERTLFSKMQRRVGKKRGSILRQSEQDRRWGGLASWPQGVFWLFEWTPQCLMLSVLAQTEVWALYSSGIELSVSHSLKQSFSQLSLLFAVLPLHSLSVIWQQPAETDISFNTG